MTMIRTLAGALLVLLAVGCAGAPVPQTDRERLVAIELVFTAAVEQADAAAVRGDLEGAALAGAQAAVAAGAAALDQAHAAVGQPAFYTALGALDAALATLQAIMAAPPEGEAP